MIGGPPPEPGFEEAFDRLYPRAARLARRIVGGPSAAEDVAAEALARAYARWAKLAWAPHLDGWVLRVAANLAIDRDRRHPAPEGIRLALTAALGSLPRRQRQAVALRYLGDLSDREVAEALGISLGSVKTHLGRGLAGLRARLGPGMEEVVPLGVDG